MSIHLERVAVEILTAEEIDLWEQACMAFGDAEVVSRGRLSTYGVMTSNVRHFVKRGMLEIEGKDVRIIRGITIEERKPPVIREVVVNETDRSPKDASPEETWAIIQTFGTRELDLFRSILANTIWPDKNGTNLVRLSAIKEEGFEKQEIIDLLNRFPGFDLYSGSSTLALPSWWQEIPKLITLP